MTDGRFGLSTRPFLGERLAERHLDLVAGHGFFAVEVVAHPAHFDVSDLTAPPRLASWLASRSMHLDAVSVSTEQSLASADGGARTRAVEEATSVLNVAREVPFRYLIVQLRRAGATAPPAESAAAARHSLEVLGEVAESVGVRVAVEALPNPLTRPEALVRLIEGELEDVDIGICLNFGEAHLMGDLADAIELVSGHVTTMHLHDNRRRVNDYLPPFSGTIDWDAAMMETQKIGYDGRLIFDVVAQGSAADTLARCADARARLERTFDWQS